MMIRIATLLLVSLLAGCASRPQQQPPQSAFEQGVAAYRARDYAKARMYWSKAVDDGETAPLTNLGYLVFYGLGGDADVNRAIRLWKRAAALGHSEAQLYLGIAFEEGRGLPRSYVEAYAWYRCAIASAEASDGEKEVEKQVSQDATHLLSAIRRRLSPEQLRTAERRAKHYIYNYAPMSASN